MTAHNADLRENDLKTPIGGSLRTPAYVARSVAGIGSLQLIKGVILDRHPPRIIET